MSLTWLQKTDDEMELFMAERQRVCHVCYRSGCDGNCQASAYRRAPEVSKETSTPEINPTPPPSVNRWAHWVKWLLVVGVVGYLVWFWASAILEATL